MKNPHAVSLGRLGGLKGGKARAKALPAAQRQAIARRAAQARWEISMPRLHDDRIYRIQIAKRFARSTKHDVGDLEHTLFNLTLTPRERLSKGLI